MVVVVTMAGDCGGVLFDRQWVVVEVALTGDSVWDKVEDSGGKEWWWRLKATTGMSSENVYVAASVVGKCVDGGGCFLFLFSNGEI
ncbi:hypothetical protein Tco_0732811 [Tanacetum coccineum]